MGSHLWGVVLAGGGGVRLKALAQRICGDDRPKQYVPVFGARTLLRQTLDRVVLGIPPLRTVVVTLRSHARYFAGQWAGPGPPPHVLVQPADRGTAAGILFPLHWVASAHATGPGFLRAGREAVPEVDERLARAEPFLGTDEEAWALHQAYALMPKASFSRAILEPCPPCLAVAAIPGVVWSDLGTPRRVFEILGGAQDRPAWVLASDLAAS